MTNFFLLYSFIFSFGSLHAMSQVFDESLPVAMNNMTLDENNDLNRFASEGYDRVQILYNGKKKGYCPSDHEINQKHISKMDDLLNAAPSTPSRKKRSVSDLHTPDIKLINSLSDRNAKTLEIKLKSMKSTPEKSKERIINSLAHKNRSSIIGNEANEVYQNDLLLHGYTTKSHVNNLISRNINELLSPEKVSAVAYHHIMHPV
ncbi:MAG: hypothetical protein U0945_07005, partial [Flavobacterium sp.]|nr:hypothetical protein [Flavobacterium sp.]